MSSKRTPVLIKESAKLNTYSKKVYSWPPTKGIQLGHTHVTRGN